MVWSGSGPASAQQLNGFNIIAVPGHAYGGTSAGRALAAATRLGARMVAIVPFLWQARPDEARIGRGQDMSDDQLRAAIRQARSLGLSVMVKPHVWVPQSWAGAVSPQTEADWQTWFGTYRAALTHIAQIASDEKADVLAIGTELAKTTQRPEWLDLIDVLRMSFPRRLTYIAHNADEAERIAFWPRLDAVGVSLYPPLGTDSDRAGRIKAMRAVAERLDRLAERTGRDIVVGEIGLRSAVGATLKPWESAEERQAAADPILQAQVLADWVSVLHRPRVRSVLIWRWFTDPSAGGLADTDFTVQGKPAEGVLLCAWTGGCPGPLARNTDRGGDR
jgi:hypothetical protein